jgi:SAM-dependent methyltransferase
VTDGWLGGDTARETNDRFASAYDDFNHLRYRNTRWTGRLLGRAEAAGLEGNHLLDVACGTGLSFIPMLRRGWSVTACDISSEMLNIAREKVGDLVPLHRADVRELPTFGSFDLVWAINDPLNYLLSKEELDAGLVGMSRNLKPGGVLIFDLNTIYTYRTFFSDEFQIKSKRRHFIWSGREHPGAVKPGLIAEARFEAVGEPASVHIHRQRHFPESVVLASVEAADLKVVEVLGVSEPEGELSAPLNEEVDTKAVYVCKPGPAKPRARGRVRDK